MDKKLPCIFSNKIGKKINNNSEYYVSFNERKIDKPSKEEIINKINDIFNSNNYIYRVNVIISLKDNDIIKKVIGKKDNYLITIDGEYINIDDIYDIKIKD